MNSLTTWNRLMLLSEFACRGFLKVFLLISWWQQTSSYVIHIYFWCIFTKLKTPLYKKYAERFAFFGRNSITVTWIINLIEKGESFGVNRTLDQSRISNLSSEARRSNSNWWHPFKISPSYTAYFRKFHENKFLFQGPRLMPDFVVGLMEKTCLCPEIRSGFPLPKPLKIYS